MILDVGNCRPRHLFAHVERGVWKPLGYQLFGWVQRQDVPSETEEEDDAATGLVKKEEAATGPKAFLGGPQKWMPGPVAEPMPKKPRGSAGIPEVAATSPRTRLTRGPAAREQNFNYPVEDAATGPGDEDW